MQVINETLLSHLIVLITMHVEHIKAIWMYFKEDSILPALPFQYERINLIFVFEECDTLMHCSILFKSLLHSKCIEYRNVGIVLCRWQCAVALCIYYAELGSMTQGVLKDCGTGLRWHSILGTWIILFLKAFKPSL